MSFEEYELVKMKELYYSEVNQVTVNLVTNISHPGLAFFVQKIFGKTSDFEQEKATYSMLKESLGAQVEEKAILMESYNDYSQ